MCSSGLLGRIVDTKIYFEAKTPVSMPFFYRSTCFSSVEVLACFWTVPGQSGAELPIVIYALNTHLTNRKKKIIKITSSFFSLEEKGAPLRATNNTTSSVFNMPTSYQ